MPLKNIAATAIYSTSLYKPDQSRFHLSWKKSSWETEIFQGFWPRVSTFPVNIFNCTFHRIKRKTAHCIIWYQPFYCVFCSQENKDAPFQNLQNWSIYMVNTENVIASLPLVNLRRVLFLWTIWWGICLMLSWIELCAWEVAARFPSLCSVLHNVSQFCLLALTASVHNHWHSRLFFSCSIPCCRANAIQLKICF